MVVQPLNVFADSISDMEKEKQSVTQKKSSVEKDIETKQAEMNQIVSDVKTVSDNLNRVSKEIKETNEKLKEQTKKVKSEEAQVKRLENEIAALEKQIAERQVVLEKRARAIQTSGSSNSYLTILLQAEDFGDFIDRANLVQVLVSADQEIMTKQKNDQELLDQKQVDSEKKLAELNRLAKQIAVTKNNLESQKAEQNELILTLAAKKDKTEQEKALLETQKGQLTGEEQKLLSNISDAYAEEQRKKEAAAKKAIEDQRKKVAAERAEAQAEASTAGSAAQAGNGNETAIAPPAYTPPASNGSMFIRPAQGILTSGFSDRVNPVTGQYESHKGQDIAAGGTVQVVAAAEGKVVFAGYGAPGSGYGGYGYVVEIDHGNGYQTLYAHMRAGSLNVTAGQQVMQGQAIGIMGSTGQSTGQHLHFEIHLNGVPIDPAPYL
ncbi:hypothetical protein MFLO_15069 [Listeria floridensis FSL S10-1187]|uniref:Peptidase M23 domain-containing protein n=1 Tax=Listeria floridensis FSL S10-1187 TaxID=1265817 RepID=A0ABP3ATT7_9LIST|nr:M23 family metallopeptidase [Listeria floridensis]EUJ25569.1 hypothetical protein MFLO_15069 [Listeria floridensis FSL S10-1187]